MIETEPVMAQAMLLQLVTKIRALTTRAYEFSTLAASNQERLTPRAVSFEDVALLLSIFSRSPSLPH